MFHATARALNSAAEQRMGDDRGIMVAQVEDVFFDEPEAPAIGQRMVDTAVDPEALKQLHSEYRWADSKLMQASERLAEAQESRRKDLVALACMRRELRASFEAERVYTQGQMRLFTEVLPKLRAHENELAELVAVGSPTAAVLRDLAAVRTERKLYELATSQSETQVARIADNEATLEYEVANEQYDAAPDGRTMRELARLRTAQTRAQRMAVTMGKETSELLATLNLDRSFGEIAAIGSFLAAEYEGDARSHARVERVRQAQMQRELDVLPAPAKAWKAGLLHPVSWYRARRMQPLV